MKINWQPMALTGSCAVLPARRVTNAQLASAILEPTNSFLTSHAQATVDLASNFYRHTGISVRRHAQPSQATSDLAALAVGPLLTGISTEQLEALVLATTSGDMPSPASAHFVHRALGLPAHVHCFDVASSCTSFLSAMRAAVPLVGGGDGEGGAFRQAIVVASEVKHKSLGEGDVRTRSLFGDGAAAFRLCSASPLPPPPSSSAHGSTNRLSHGLSPQSRFEGYATVVTRVDSSLAGHICIPVGGSREPADAHNLSGMKLQLNEPKKLFIHTVHAFVEAIELAWAARERFIFDHFGAQGAKEAAARTGGLIYVHQANANLLTEVKKRLPPDLARRLPILMADVGNLVCASLPVARVRARMLEGLFALMRQHDLGSLQEAANLPGLVCAGETTLCYLNESLCVNDLGWQDSNTSSPWFLDPLAAEVVASTREAFEVGRPDHRHEAGFVDVWVAAGGGFQTIASLHARVS